MKPKRLAWKGQSFIARDNGVDAAPNCRLLSLSVYLFVLSSIITTSTTIIRVCLLVVTTN